VCAGRPFLPELRLIFHVPCPPSSLGAGHEKQDAFARGANLIALKNQSATVYFDFDFKLSTEMFSP
jgi:hypothetical protein